MVPCMSPSKADLKILCEQPLLLLCLCRQAQMKTGLNAVPLRPVRVIFRRKIVLEQKSQCSRVDIGLAQLSSKFCFHLEAKPGL